MFEQTLKNNSTLFIGSPINRADLSHAIHADNCILHNKGNCSIEDPAYTWRDYSSLIYLNSDFIGGKFIFAEDERGDVIQSVVEPKCGRGVAFTADDKNLHGVTGVIKGKRCALALWFTHDESQIEVERILAKAVLQRVLTKGTVKIMSKFLVPFWYEDLLVEKFKEDIYLKEILKDIDIKTLVVDS